MSTLWHETMWSPQRSVRTAQSVVEGSRTERVVRHVWR